MKDFRKLLPSVREFKRPAILTIIFIVLEVFIEVVIPFLTADMVNAIKDGAPLEGVVKTGLFLVLLAVLSLMCSIRMCLVCRNPSVHSVSRMWRPIILTVDSVFSVTSSMWISVRSSLSRN